VGGWVGLDWINPALESIPRVALVNMTLGTWVS
jgi:hypothetical protein